MSLIKKMFIKRLIQFAYLGSFVLGVFDSYAGLAKVSLYIQTIEIEQIFDPESGLMVEKHQQKEDSTFMISSVVFQNSNTLKISLLKLSKFIPESTHQSFIIETQERLLRFEERSIAVIFKKWIETFEQRTLIKIYFWNQFSVGSPSLASFMEDSRNFSHLIFQNLETKEEKSESQMFLSSWIEEINGPDLEPTPEENIQIEGIHSIMAFDGYEEIQGAQMQAFAKFTQINPMCSYKIDFYRSDAHLYARFLHHNKECQYLKSSQLNYHQTKVHLCKGRASGPVVILEPHFLFNASFQMDQLIDLLKNLDHGLRLKLVPCKHSSMNWKKETVAVEPKYDFVFIEPETQKEMTAEEFLKGEKSKKGTKFSLESLQPVMQWFQSFFNTRQN